MNSSRILWANQRRRAGGDGTEISDDTWGLCLANAADKFPYTCRTTLGSALPALYAEPQGKL